MNKQPVFPFVSPREEFRRELRRELLVEFGEQTRPKFRWGWLVFSGTMASLFVIFIFSGGYVGSNYSLSLNSLQVERREYTDTLELEMVDLGEIDKELDDVSLALSQDQDINAAIALEEL